MNQKSVLLQSVIFPLHTSTNVNFLNLFINLRVSFISVYYNPPEDIYLHFQDTFFIYWKKGRKKLLYPFSKYRPDSLRGDFYYLQSTKLFSIFQINNIIKSTKVRFVIFLCRSLARMSLTEKIIKLVIFLDSCQMTITFLGTIRKKRYWKFSEVRNTLKSWRNSPSPSGILTTRLIRNIRYKHLYLSCQHVLVHLAMLKDLLH